MVKKLAMVVLAVMCFASMTACTDYGYNFHFSVVGGHGEITTDREDLLKGVDRCNETLRCELECPNNSNVVSRLGGKKGGHELAFVAIPDEGYKVKEWTLNGERLTVIRQTHSPQ